MTLIIESKQEKAIKSKKKNFKKENRKVFIESYGCQMNFSDSEIVASIMQKDGFVIPKNIKKQISFL